MIMGQESSDSGEFVLGETVKLGYIDQSHIQIDPEKTVYEVISGGTDQFMMGGKMVLQVVHHC
jgi:ATPase subunit of ABC transporter with duplicated ATPase domains